MSDITSDLQVHLRMDETTVDSKGVTLTPDASGNDNSGMLGYNIFSVLAVALGGGTVGVSDVSALTPELRSDDIFNNCLFYSILLYKN